MEAKKTKYIIRSKSKTEPKFTFVDLFCGIGGFHVAMSQLGGQCLFASDIDKNCQRIYQINHNLTPVGDIQQYPNVPQHDILCAGFPCQPFSNGGKKQAFADKRGLLFDNIVNILRTNRTPFAILENVKHIRKVSNGAVYKYIYQQLSNIGYKVFDLGLSPTDLKIPQNRERVIFVVIRQDLYTDQYHQLFMTRLSENKTLYSRRNQDMVIYEKSPSPIYNITPEISTVLRAWDQLIQIFSQVGDIISPIIPEYFTQQPSADNSDWKNSYIDKNRTFYQKYQTLIDPWHQTNKNILTKKAVYGKLEWQTGGIHSQDTIYKYFIQIRQSGIRVKKTDCFPALVAIVQTPIIASQQRYLTPRECARLQSLPDNFSFGDQCDKLTYKQLGNGVNVDIIKIIGDTLINTHEYFINKH